MNDKLKNITQKSECPSMKMFYNYIEEHLLEKEKNAFERHLAECELCSEALEGLELTSRAKAEKIISEINDDIISRTAQKPFYLSIGFAASLTAILLVGTYFIVNEIGEKKQISVVTEKEKSIQEKSFEPIKNNEISTEKIAEEKQELAIETTPQKTSKRRVIQEEKTSSPTKILEVNEDAMMAQEYEDLATDDEAETSINLDKESAVNIAGTAASSYTTSDNTITAKPYTAKSSDTYKHMLAYATEVNNSLKITSNDSKQKEQKKTYESYAKSEDMNTQTSNAVEINKIIKLLDEEKYTDVQKTISVLKTNANQESEKYTLIWLEAFIKLAQNEDAKTELTELKKTKNPYQEKAKELLK